MCVPQRRARKQYARKQVAYRDGNLIPNPPLARRDRRSEHHAETNAEKSGDQRKILQVVEGADFRREVANHQQLKK